MTALYRQRYRIPSIRLSNWDYRSPGLYFITMCVRNRWTQPFGFIRNGFICLSDIGTIAHRYWLDIPNHFPNVSLDTFVIMPDHVHGIIRIHDNRSESYHRSVNNNQSVETRYIASLQNDSYIQNGVYIPNRMYNRFGGLPSNSLSSIIHTYKSAVTRWGNAHNQFFQWQSRYFEKIIRSQRELHNVRRYILNNPRSA